MIWAIIKTIFLGGISSVSGAVRDVKIAELQNKNHALDSIETITLERLKTDAKLAEQAKEIRIATKDHIEMRIAIGIIVITTAMHYGFIVLDHTYRMGWNIMPLPAPLDEWQATIILSFFGIKTVNYVSNIIAAVLRDRSR